MNTFGGFWTENKIDILVKYAKAYLEIMKIYASQNDWRLLYFDGFAGSGDIEKLKGEEKRIIIGAAKRILEIEDPRPFDLYYFVEKDKKNHSQLEEQTKGRFPGKIIYVVNGDCNAKILDMSKYLMSPAGNGVKTLAYIDPCGMQLNWSSLVALQKQAVDLWVLIPTGMGVNRLLSNDFNQINDAWASKLETFLGMTRQEIFNYFYNPTLFETYKVKRTKAIDRSAQLYRERLNTLFKFVSNPYVLRTNNNTVMFHFLMASNNPTAVKIANDIIKQYNKNNGAI